MQAAAGAATQPVAALRGETDGFRCCLCGAAATAAPASFPARRPMRALSAALDLSASPYGLAKASPASSDKLRPPVTASSAGVGPAAAAAAAAARAPGPSSAALPIYYVDSDSEHEEERKSSSHPLQDREPAKLQRLESKYPAEQITLSL